MKALGIDFGVARIGVSICDEMGVTARPLKTLTIGDDPEDGIKEVKKLVKDESIELVVVGHPIRMDGTIGDSAKRVEGWVEMLGHDLPDGIGVELMDERLSTKEAEKRIKQASKKAQKKMEIDAVAASVILQDYLDENQEGGPEMGDMMEEGPDGDLSLAAFDDGDEFDGLGGDDGFDEDDDDKDEFGSLDEYDEDGDDSDRNSDFGYGGIWDGQNDM